MYCYCALSRLVLNTANDLFSDCILFFFVLFIYFSEFLALIIYPHFYIYLFFRIFIFIYFSEFLFLLIFPNSYFYLFFRIAISESSYILSGANNSNEGKYEEVEFIN